MKLTVRALIAILVLTGAAATTQTSSASARNKVTARASMLPVPVCAPDDPNACGMGHGR
jgi:hypothetical protein